MNYRDYIDSGILQDYCLGLLSDEEKRKVEDVCRQSVEVKKELEQIQQSLEKQALQNAVQPRQAMKEAIWNTLQVQDKEAAMSLDNLPVVTRHADIKKWLNLVKPLLPSTVEEGDSFSVMLQDTGKIMQKVLMTRKNYPYEMHEDVVEGLLLLEGSCTCEIDGKDYDFVQGDLIEIPTHIVHNLRVTSPHLILIVQHLAA